MRSIWCFNLSCWGNGWNKSVDKGGAPPPWTSTHAQRHTTQTCTHRRTQTNRNQNLTVVCWILKHGQVSQFSFTPSSLYSSVWSPLTCSLTCIWSSIKPLYRLLLLRHTGFPWRTLPRTDTLLPTRPAFPRSSRLAWLPVNPFDCCSGRIVI